MATEAHGEETGGLVFHPLDQFIVKPLFQQKDVLVAVDPSSGTGTTSGGETVSVTADQIASFTDGHDTYVSLFDAGIQAIHWYTITNVTLWMALAVISIVLLFVLGSRGRALVPSRSQSIGEVLYGFTYKMVEDVAGKDAIKFFPYIMTVFMFILFANFLGLLPMSFATTSHIAVTGVLAVAVFLTVTLVGFFKHGLGFLKLFWVSSAPLLLRPVLAIIELISYFVRPLSHSIRLGGNIMAGHAVMKVFAGFAGLAIVSPVAVLSITAMYALEVLVAGVQAYVFAILTCVYLKDALHPAH